MEMPDPGTEPLSSHKLLPRPLNAKPRKPGGNAGTSLKRTLIYALLRDKLLTGGIDRILRDGVAQQVQPHDGHGEAEHRNRHGS